MNALTRFFTTFPSLSVLTGLVLIGCTAINSLDSSTPTQTPNTSQETSTLTNACQVTKPIWVKPPEDSAVDGSPGYRYYFVNKDRSIWASAWWTGEAEDYLRVSREGIKVGWFRSAGVVLEITGQRIDAQAPPLDAHVPCCYPTRFQATGLIFPTEGCWEVTARAVDRVLSFIVRVEP